MKPANSCPTLATWTSFAGTSVYTDTYDFAPNSLKSSFAVVLKYYTKSKALIQQIDFTDVVFHGLLSLLLFAGALHVDLTRLRQHRIAILTLATIGVVISTAAVGGGFYLLMAAIVPATESDVPAIHALITALAEYERLSHEVVSTEADIRNSLFGTRPYAEVILAKSDGQTVGFALFFHNYSTFLARRGLYLEDLFVLPAFRSRGVGRRLLSYLARLAVERKCGRMEWWVLDWNESAIRFYQSLGAIPMNDWTVYRLTGDALDRVADL